LVPTTSSEIGEVARIGIPAVQKQYILGVQKDRFMRV
jgi:hypothetical protein